MSDANPDGRENSRVGAVAYINMLPYFHLGNVPVFPTPRLLNDSARAGRLDLACTSAIAGLRAGWKPLAPLHGIGARGDVRSVFLEPVPLHARHAPAWDLFPRTIEGALVRHSGGAVAKPAAYAPLAGPACSGDAGLVTLFTSGASEHSEWLSCLLLQAAGHSVRVVREPALATLPEETLRSFVAEKAPVGLAALLFIGDPALVRVLRDPLVPRFDLARLWRLATNLPCVFAVWFDCRPGGGEAVRSAAGEGGENEQSGAFLKSDLLEENLRAWESLDSAGRRLSIEWFLHVHAPGIRSQLPAGCDALAFFECYLEGIACRFDAEFSCTLTLYESLLTVS